MCGSGRTGHSSSCEQDGVVPDIVTLGKGLGAGYQPIGAVVCTRDVYETVAQGSGALKHGQTYNAHPVGCAAALAVQRVIQDEGLLGASRRGRADAALADRALRQSSAMSAISVAAACCSAMELVADRATKAPFDAALRSISGPRPKRSLAAC